VLERLRQQVAASDDDVLRDLETELAGAAGPSSESTGSPVTSREPPLVVPLVIDTALGRLSFISTTTVFGTPVDITLAELALESFFPADPATAAAACGARSNRLRQEPDRGSRSLARSCRAAVRRRRRP
jgi:hypothetical protein